MTTRRLFLRAGAAALAAPAIVRASSIMKIWTPPAPREILMGLDLASGPDLAYGGYVIYDDVHRISRFELFEVSLVGPPNAGLLEMTRNRPFEFTFPDRLQASPVAQSRIKDIVACAQDDVGGPARLKSNRFLTGVAGGLASTPGDSIS